MNSLIIGTAGHIDHGKTALIRALNGFEGDRLEEEKKRGITIDLSFSNLQNGEQNIAFIDVPGHENLLKTMISGAFGFDTSLVVIAANEGIMPQSVEHIKILSYLNIKNIIVALSKCDLADSEMINLRKSEIKNFIAKFPNLELLEIFETSIKNQTSIDELKNYLFTLKATGRANSGLFRYYIDRVFSLKGVGVVLTGSVIDGEVRKGEKLHNYDLGKDLLVKSIQIHEHFSDIATIGNRVALGVSGIEISQLKKGQILSKKGFFRGFEEIDCVVNADSLTHNAEVLFCVGAKQISAKILILSQKDKSYFVSFRFEKPVFLKYGEAFVLLANSHVIGGGRVLNPIAEPMKKKDKISFLNFLQNGDFLGAFAMLKATHKKGFGLISSFQRFDLSHGDALEIAKKLPNAFVDEAGLNVYDESAIFRIKDFINFMLSKNQFAIFSATSISLKLSWATQNIVQKAINELVNEGKITQNSGIYTKFGVNFDDLRVKIEDKIYDILDKAGLTPDAPYNIYESLEIDRLTGDNVLKKLTNQNRVIRLEHNLFVTKNNLENAVTKLKDIIKKEGLVNVTTAKDRLGLSRKYAIAYLEYLDKSPDIAKNGQNRVLK